MKRNLIMAFAGLALLAGCNESQDSGLSPTNLSTTITTGGSVTEISGTSATVLDNYDQSSFSKYVYWHKVDAKVLVDYNFFPGGTDFDSQLLKATIPCGSELTVSDDVSVSMSAPESGTENTCSATVVDLSLATFSIDGLIFDYTSSLDVFAKQFGFKVSASGFTDASSGSAIDVSFDLSGLQNVVDALNDQ